MERSSSPRYLPPVHNNLVIKAVDPIQSFSAPRKLDHPAKHGLFSPFDDLSETESESSYTYIQRRPKPHDDLRNSTGLEQCDDRNSAPSSHSRKSPHSNSPRQHAEKVFGPGFDLPIEGTHLASRAKYNQYSGEKDRRAGILKGTKSPTQGSAINHYPYPERHKDIVSAIATADRVFEKALVAKESEWTKSGSKSHPAKSTIDATCADRQRDTNAALVPADVDELVRTEGQKTKPAYPCGNRGGQYTTGNGLPESLYPMGNANGPTRPPGGRGYGSDRTQDDPDPEDTPITLDSPGVDDHRRFTCVFHNSDHPRCDLTKHCKTFQKFVSHLRIHHGGNKHLFFYCTTCMTRFATEKAREDHDKPERCKHLKCVTEDCPNFGTYITANCNHAGKGRDNSQLSIWNALRCLAYTPMNIMSPNAIRRASHSEGTGSAYYQAQTEATPSLQTPNVVSSSSPNFHVSSGSSSQAHSDRCENQLRMFTRAILSYLDQPEPEGLDMLHDMYSAYMNHDFSGYIESLQPLDRRTAIQGLLSLNIRLWKIVKKRGVAKQQYIQMLRTWAEQVLSSHETSESSPAAMEPKHSRIDEQDSPTEAAVERRSKGKQRQTEARIDADLDNGPHAIDSMLLAAPSFGHAHNFDYESLNQDAGQIEPICIDPRHIQETSNSYNATSFFPFTQRDSAAAIRTPGNNQHYQRTTDSGYSTADRNYFDSS